MSGLLTAIKGIVSGKGTDLIKSVGDVVDDLTLSKEEKEKLKLDLMNAANSHVEKMEAEATKRIEAELKDMDSARNRETTIATSDKAPLINKIVTPILAFSVVGLTFLLFYLIMFKGIKGIEKDILIYVLGALTSYVGMILSYFFGSSSSSKHKQETIEKLIK